MAFPECFAILLGYSGGAVPESHRVPCSSAAKTRAADHQRTLTPVTLSACHRDVKTLVKRIWIVVVTPLPKVI
jgi:hypothetical protein